MSEPLDQAKVKLYAGSIYNSLRQYPESVDTVRQDAAEGTGSPEWQEARRQALARFEAAS